MPTSARSKYDRIVSTAWALSRRPRLYTPTGSLGEVIAYLVGMLDPLGPTILDKKPIDASQRFAVWLTARHGHSDPEALSPAAQICFVLAKVCADPLDGMWREFEAFSDEQLGVPKGTYPAI